MTPDFSMTRSVPVVSDTTRTLLVSPRFTGPPLYMYKALCRTLGAHYPTAPLGLMTVAAMLPPTWACRLIDCNVQDITVEDLDWADVVMTGGMLTQQNGTLEIIRRAQARGRTVVVGGPDVTSSPQVYAEADIQVLGEAESVIAAFLDAWNAGIRHGVFDAEKFKADMTQSPVPRFDLIESSSYLHVALQFSRGCPFNCEFCDIIELYGRLPRTKTPDQMIRELDALYLRGHRGWVFFVDDNFIGNKKELRLLIPMLVAWQKERGYPFEFSVQATINLADDPALLAMMCEANFVTVFIGIESPDPEALVATQKKQNARRDLIVSVAKIHAAGMFVHAGFIIGFDKERETIAPAMTDYIQSASITLATTGLLLALPGTQLTKRLEREGRLHPNAHLQPTDDEFTLFGGGAGLNFDTARPRRDVLADYRTVLETLYNPASYFARLRAEARSIRRPALKTRPGTRTRIRELRAVIRLVLQISTTRWDVQKHFWRSIIDCARHDLGIVKYVMMLGAAYLDIDPFRALVSRHVDRQVDVIDRGEWRSPTIRLPRAADA